MCGIFAVVKKEESLLGPMLLEAGRRLSYRGYDSVGIATFQAGKPIDLRKDVGKIDDLSQQYSFHTLTGDRAIIQLRWATFGIPSQINAQPHLDSDGDLAGAHNGNIINNIELQQQFQAEGMSVRSMNDGESCVHAVERYVNRGLDLVEATCFAYQDLVGDYSFVIGKVNEDRLCAVKKGTGLFVGMLDDATCVSSDLQSILPLTRRVVRINDGEIVVLWADYFEIRRIADGSIVNRETEIITSSIEAVSKSGFDHFMIKEIYEQPQAAEQLVNVFEESPQVYPFVEKMADARHLYLVGCGSSYHATLIGAYYSACLADRLAIPVQASQFVAHAGSILGPGDVAVFVSQSGETKDILTAEEVARQKGTTTLSITNKIDSSLARVTQSCLPLSCGYEISLPATKSFSNQVIAFLYLSLMLKNLPTTSLIRLSELMNQTIEIVEPQVKTLAARLALAEEYYCLGFGSTYGVALEGALKLKEVTYAHCEGMLSSEFKHGPLSAVQRGYPLLFIAGPDDIPVMISGINEVICRGGSAIVIGEENSNLQANATFFISVPHAGPLINPILSVLPLQLLAYHTSLARGLDPDLPRNLSKTLTVD